MTERHHSRLMNALIERLLLAPEPPYREQLTPLVMAEDIGVLAERIRRQATRLGRQRPDIRRQLLHHRNELILQLYATLAPSGWGCGWSDGALFTLDGERQAGIGGLLFDSNGNAVASFSHRCDATDAFRAELAALDALIELALEYRQRRLWLYCDNQGVVRLWHQQRHDPRLEPLRRRVASLERFALRDIPRLHNQAANALARMAIKTETALPPEHET